MTASGDSIFLCKTSEISEGRNKKFVISGNEIVLVKLDGKIHAIEPICSHLWSDLSHGKFNARARTVQCPLHGAIFDISTGAALMGPFGCDGDMLPPLRLYKFRIEQDSVLIDRRQEWGDISLTESKT